MDNKKIYVTAVTASVIAFIGGLLIGVMNPFKQTETSPTKQVESAKAELSDKQKELNALQKKYDELVSKKEPKQNTQIDTSKLEKFFTTMLAYNQSQWTSRYKDALQYATKKALHDFDPIGPTSAKIGADAQGYISKFEYYPSNTDPQKGIAMVTYGMKTGNGNNHVTAEWNVKMDETGLVTEMSKKRFEKEIE